MSRLHTPGILVPFLERRTYAETAHLLLDLVVGTAYISVFVTLLATGASLLITLVGLPILSATMYLARAAAGLERRRIGLFLGDDVAAPARTRVAGGGIVHQLLAPFRDAPTRKELVYVAVIQPMLGIGNFTVTAVAWLVPLWLVALPFYAASSSAELWNGERLTWTSAAPAGIAGLLLLLLTPKTVRALAAVERAVARRFIAAEPEPEVRSERTSDLVMGGV